MRKKRIMIIGPSKSGKTTLANTLNNDKGPIRRTQDIIYGKNTIDIPSSYIENTWMYKHLIAVSQDASHVLILIDPTKCHHVYSPGFARAFKCPVIGVISKIDLIREDEKSSVKQLQEIGVTEAYFKISIPMEIGIKDLKDHLFLRQEK